jgi:hypothetical protein
LRVLGSIDFELFLPILWFCRFSCRLLAFVVFLLLDDRLELFVGFWSSSCVLWGSWIRTSNFVPFVVNGLVKGEIEKPNG